MRCAERRNPQQCIDLSATLARLIDAVSPGALLSIANEFQRGYRLDDSVVVQCEIGVTCDAWPVAALAADAVAESGCPPDADLCTALSIAASEAFAAESLPVLDKVATEVATATIPQGRVSALEDAVRGAIVNLPLTSEGSGVADTVVAAAYLALVLPPARSIDAGIPEPAGTVGVDLVESPNDGAVMMGDDALYVQAGPTELGSTGRCSAIFDLWASLRTENASVTQFEMFGWAGVANLRWVNTKVSHARCLRPSVDFTGSVFVEAISNAGSFIASKTKRSPLVQASETLQWQGPPAAVDIHWVTDKVELEYEFPIEFTIHNYAPRSATTS